MIAGVILVGVAAWMAAHQEKSSPETFNLEVPAKGRATSARGGSARPAPTSAPAIESNRRPPPAPEPTSTSIAGGDVTPEAPVGSPSEDVSGDICEEDIDAVFDLCDPAFAKSDCAGVAAEEGEACQAGCVMQTCPKLRDCAKPDPPWCGSPCDDARGGLFWRTFWSAYYACTSQVGSAQPALGDCTTSHVEERCPELAGTGWTARFRGLHK